MTEGISKIKSIMKTPSSGKDCCLVLGISIQIYPNVLTAGRSNVVKLISIQWLLLL